MRSRARLACAALFVLFAGCGASRAAPSTHTVRDETSSPDGLTSEPAPDGGAPVDDDGGDAAEAVVVATPPASAPTPPEPEPHPRSRFGVVVRIEGAGCPGEVSIAAGSCERAVRPEEIGLRVHRDAVALRRAGLVLAEPVDFDRWIVLVRGELEAGSSALRVVRLPAEIEGGTVTVRIGDPCAGICGGASSVELHRAECALAHAADVWLAPRPAASLRVVDVHTHCAEALP